MLNTLASLAGGVKNSVPAQFLTQHWHEVPAENIPGASWQQIVKEGQSYHCHLPTGNLYRPELKSWLAVKNLAILWVGAPIYFGASFARYLGTGLYEAANTAHGLFLTWQSTRNSPDFNWPAILSDGQGRSVFKSVPGYLYQALWCGVPFALLYTNAFYANTIFLTLGSLYAAFNPLDCRVAIESLQERVRPTDVVDLPEDQFAPLNVQNAVNHFTSGSLSLTQLFRMNKIAKQEPPLEKTQKAE